MNKQPQYREGAPCWADLATPDLAGARRFYGALLGWTFDVGAAEFGGYVTVRKDGASVCGMMQPPPEQGGPPCWGVYLKTSDMDASARTITEAGGKALMGPHAVGELGVMLVAEDPTGAVFGLWQMGLHRGAEAFGVPGAMCWHELNTRDAAAADAFFRRLFGYTLSSVESTEKMDYMTYHVDGRAVCGRLKMTAEWGDLPPHWMTYFAVADVDADVARLPALEGKLHHGPFDTPYGRIAVVSDPYGAVFSLIQMPAQPAS